MSNILTDKQTDALLASRQIGRIGCHDGHKIYVVPVTYVYDGEYIYCHSREGLKLDILRKNPRLCFQVDHIRQMNDWDSVIIQGVFEELKGTAAESAAGLLISRLKDTVTSKTALPHEPGDSPDRRETKGFTAILFRISILERTGRCERPG